MDVGFDAGFGVGGLTYHDGVVIGLREFKVL